MITRPAPQQWMQADTSYALSVATLASTAFDPHYQEAWTSSQIHSILAADTGWMLVWLNAQLQVQAFALCRTILDETELLLCATHPDVRRQGLGRQMLQAVRDHAEKRGSQMVFLEVRRDNIAAINLYEAAGFAITGTRPGYYSTRNGTRIDALTLTLNLAT